MPADSLRDISLRACARLHPRIWSVGDLPYKLVRPMLVRVQSPEQLHAIEQASPQLIGETEELWLNFLKRDVPNYETKPHMPTNPANWFKVWKKLRKEALAEMSKGEDKLIAELASIKQAKEKNKSQIVSTKQLPKQKQDTRSVIRHSYNSGKTGSKGAHKMSPLQKIMKDSARATAHNRKDRPIRSPTKLRQAPVQFVADERRKNEAQRRQVTPPKPMSTTRQPKPPMHGPRKVSPPKLEDLDDYDIMKDRETRLKAMKTKQVSSPPPKHTKNEPATLTAEDLEDTDDDEPRLQNSKQMKRPPTAISPAGRMESPTRREGSPVLAERSGSPVGRGGGRMAASPEPKVKMVRVPKLGHPAPDQRATSPMRVPKTASPVPVQRPGSPTPLQRAGSPMRTSSPRPMLKRKEPPSIFHKPAKRPAVRTGVS